MEGWAFQTLQIWVAGTFYVQDGFLVVEATSIVMTTDGYNFFDLLARAMF